MKKRTKVVIGVLLVGACIGGVMDMLGIESSADPKRETAAVVEIQEPVNEQTDAERLGVSEKVLGEIEHIMGVAGYEYTRKDITRIYRLTPEQMTLNPEKFADYDVTVTDGTTHRITINIKLIGE